MFNEDIWIFQFSIFGFSRDHCIKVQEKLENNAYAKFGGTDKEYYGILQSGLLYPDN